MANSTGVKNLSLRGNIYYAYLTVNGKRARFSLDTDDLPLAIERLDEARRRIKPIKSKPWDAKPRIQELMADQPNLAKTLLSGARARSKAKGHQCLLSMEDIEKIIRRSGWKCEVTGIPFTYAKSTSGKRSPFAPSLDKVDPAKMYEAKNCRLVCTAVNIALSDWGDSVLRAISIGYCKNNVL